MVDYHTSSHWKITHITLQGTAIIKKIYICDCIIQCLPPYSFINHIIDSVVRFLNIFLIILKTSMFVTYST
jgi:hypothetical protein